MRIKWYNEMQIYAMKISVYVTAYYTLGDVIDHY